MTWMCQGGDTTCSAWSLRERARYGRWAAAETDRRSERWIYAVSQGLRWIQKLEGTNALLVP